MNSNNEFSIIERELKLNYFNIDRFLQTDSRYFDIVDEMINVNITKTVIYFYFDIIIRDHRKFMNIEPSYDDPNIILDYAIQFRDAITKYLLGKGITIMKIEYIDPESIKYSFQFIFKYDKDRDHPIVFEKLVYYKLTANEIIRI